MTTREQLRRIRGSLSPKERARLKFQYEREESQPPQDLLTGMSKPEQIEYHRALIMLRKIFIICELTLMDIEAQLREACLLGMVIQGTTQTLVHVCERLRDSVNNFRPRKRVTPEDKQPVAEYNHILEEAQQDKTRMLALLRERLRDSLKRVSPEYKQLDAEYNHLLEEAQQDGDSISSKLEYCSRCRAGLEGFIARIRAKEFDGHDILAPTILDRLNHAAQVASELGRELGLEMDPIEANEDYAEGIWYEFVKAP